jgi:hypothetical protein
MFGAEAGDVATTAAAAIGETAEAAECGEACGRAEFEAAEEEDERLRRVLHGGNGAGEGEVAARTDAAAAAVVTAIGEENELADR